MVGALFDTNILIDYLNGIPQARGEIRRYDTKAISIVTWIEVMVGASIGATAGTRNFLDGFSLISLDDTVAERAVTLRRTHRMKLPDAIVWASAQVNGLLLVTRDSKDFQSSDPGVRIPYAL